MTSVAALEAWAHMREFVAEANVPTYEHASLGVLYGLAWDPDTRGEDPLDRQCAIHKLVPVKVEAKDAEALTALLAAPFEDGGATTEIDATVLRADRPNAMLRRLAGHDGLTHAVAFPRTHFSHLYVSLKMDEFARSYFWLLAKHTGVKRAAAAEEKKSAEFRSNCYAVFSGRDAVVVHGEKTMLECFLCYLGAEFFEFHHARVEFLYHHLPLAAAKLLSYLMVTAQMSEPKMATRADLEQFGQFCKGGGTGLPPVLRLRTRRLKAAAAELETPLLWLAALTQKHSYDLSNTCQTHSFSLTDNDKKERDIILTLARKAREVDVS